MRTSARRRADTTDVTWVASDDAPTGLYRAARPKLSFPVDELAHPRLVRRDALRLAPELDDNEVATTYFFADEASTMRGLRRR